MDVPPSAWHAAIDVLVLEVDAIKGVLSSARMSQEARDELHARMINLQCVIRKAHRELGHDDDHL